MSSVNDQHPFDVTPDDERRPAADADAPQTSQQTPADATLDATAPPTTATPAPPRPTRPRPSASSGSTTASPRSASPPP